MSKFEYADKRYCLESFKMPNPSLKAYFGNVVRGHDQILVTPFAKSEDTATLLENWASELEPLRNMWPTLFDYENEMRQKVGPLSCMKPLRQRMEDIRAYYTGILLPAEPLSNASIDAVTKLVTPSLGGLGLRSFQHTWENMKLSTNSGAPYFTKRRNLPVPTQIDIFVESKRSHNFKQIYMSVVPNEEFRWGVPAILGWRGQEGGPRPEDVKQRVVWMFPFWVNLYELTFYQPAIELLQRDRIVAPWVSNDLVDERITELFSSKGKDDLVICTDFSKYDQHFNYQMQQATKTVISTACKQSAVDEWLAKVYPIKYCIPLAIGTEWIIVGYHGMGSGSGGTNFDETIAHMCLQHEVALLNNRELNPNSLCNGDDGILSYPGISVDQVVKAYTKHGLEMNPDKQYASTEDCVFLRRWHHKDYRVNGKCVGVYSTMRALGKLRYIERYMDPKVWGSKMVALRQLSILENVKYHPLAEKFVDFCMKRDKYRLGIDIPGFFDELSATVEDAVANMPDFLGFTRSLQNDRPDYGIQNWWIVKYLKSKR